MEKTNLKPMPSNDVTLKFRLHDIKLGTVPSRDKDGHHIFSLVNFGDLNFFPINCCFRSFKGKANIVNPVNKLYSVAYKVQRSILVILVILVLYLEIFYEQLMALTPSLTESCISTVP